MLERLTGAYPMMLTTERPSSTQRMQGTVPGNRMPVKHNTWSAWWVTIREEDLPRMPSWDLATLCYSKRSHRGLQGSHWAPRMCGAAPCPHDHEGRRGGGLGGSPSGSPLRFHGMWMCPASIKRSPSSGGSGPDMVVHANGGLRASKATRLPVGKVCGRRPKRGDDLC